MEIRFAEIPAVGLSLSIGGQRFDLVEHEDYTRRDGTATVLLVWRSECATCGTGFTTKSPALALPEGRRCAAHHQPGRKVRPIA